MQLHSLYSNCMHYNEILFVRERNPDDEQWNGKRKGVEGAKN